MADNLKYNQPGVGANIATDDIAGVHYQRVKVTHGADGQATDASSASPLPVLDTAVRDRLPATLGAQGGLRVEGTVDTELPTATPLADNLAVPTTPIVGAVPMLHNGSTLDMLRGNSQEVELLAEAERTTTTNSPVQTNHNARGVLIALHVSSASGTGGLRLRVRADFANPMVDPGLYQVPSNKAITQTGTFGYMIYPGATLSALPESTNRVEDVAGVPIPRRWYITVGHSDASPYTYKVAAYLIV